MNEDHHLLHLAKTVTEGRRNTHIIHKNEIKEKRNRRELSPRAPTKKIFPRKFAFQRTKRLWLG